MEKLSFFDILQSEEVKDARGGKLYPYSHYIVLHSTKMTGGADLRSYMRFHYRKLFLDAYQTLNLTED